LSARLWLVAPVSEPGFGSRSIQASRFSVIPVKIGRAGLKPAPTAYSLDDEFEFCVIPPKTNGLYSVVDPDWTIDNLSGGVEWVELPLDDFAVVAK
jgi:hypothetical protein